MRYFIIFLLIVMFAGSAGAEPGYREVARGNRSFYSGDFKGALKHYDEAAAKNPRQPLIDFARGAAYYKENDHEKAVEYFQKGLLTDDPDFKGDVHYNLGNALYKAGVAREDRDVQGAIKSLERSLSHYEKAMAADLQDEDAKANHVFVKAELERLKEKQKQQEQQQQTCPNPKGGEPQKKEKKDPSSQENAMPSQKPNSQGEASQKESGDGQKQEPGAESKGQASQEQAGGSQAGPGSEADPSKQGRASSGQEDQGQIISLKEAQMLLDDFHQNEQPQGLLNFIRKTGNERAVQKDW